MKDDKKRLEMIIRCTIVLRELIQRNEGLYHGGMMPNLQSIIDLAVIDMVYVELAELSLAAIEKQLNISPPKELEVDPYNLGA